MYQTPPWLPSTTPPPPVDTAAASVLQDNPLPDHHRLLIEGSRHAADHMVAYLFLQLSQTSTEPGPGDMWVAPLQVAQFLAGFPQFANMPPPQIDFGPLLTFNPARNPTSLPSPWQDHFHLYLFSFHLLVRRRLHSGYLPSTCSIFVAHVQRCRHICTSLYSHCSLQGDRKEEFWKIVTWLEEFNIFGTQYLKLMINDEIRRNEELKKKKK